MLVPWYLMASYLYYCCDRSLLSDACYDELCRRLALRWRGIKHPHKSHVNYADLAAGTCLKSYEEYPGIVRGAATALWLELGKPQAAPLPASRRKPLPAQGFFV